MEELIKSLLLKSERPPIINTPVGPMLYSDNAKAYQKVLPETVLSCKSFDTFKDAVLAQVSPKDEGFIVKFNGLAAELHNPAPMALRRFLWQAAFSQQFAVVKEQVGKLYEHIGFMRLLESLRPSIKGYEQVRKRLESVFVVKGDTVKSTVSKVVRSFDQPSTLVDSFAVQMSVFDGSAPTSFTVEVDSRLDPSKNVKLGILVPAGEALEASALADLFDGFRKEMKKLRPKLLVLR